MAGVWGYALGGADLRAWPHGSRRALRLFTMRICFALGSPTSSSGAAQQRLEGMGYSADLAVRLVLPELA